MRITYLLGAICSGLLALGTTSTYAVLIIDPTTSCPDAGHGDTGVGHCDFGNENNNQDVLDAIDLLHPDLIELYKADQVNDNPPDESGSFMDDYTTEFDPANDPEDAWITHDGPDSISCGSCFALIKDGNATPAWYLFDISDWDGTEDLHFENFWTGQGAISHVSILAPIPVPAAVWLFGSGLLGLVGIARRKRT